MENFAIEILRNTTRLQQERLESRLNLVRRADSIVSYVMLLRRFLSFYKPIEERLLHVTDGSWLDTEVKLRRKCSWLAADLKALGSDPATVAACDARDLPSVASLPEALGCMFVLESATLSGQVVCRELQLRLNLERGKGLSFFSSYGAETGPMWRRFREALEAEIAHSENPDAAVALASHAACATLEALEHWLLGEESAEPKPISARKPAPRRHL